MILLDARGEKLVREWLEALMEVEEDQSLRPQIRDLLIEFAHELYAYPDRPATDPECALIPMPKLGTNIEYLKWSISDCRLHRAYPAIPGIGMSGPQ